MKTRAALIAAALISVVGCSDDDETTDTAAATTTTTASTTTRAPATSVAAASTSDAPTTTDAGASDTTDDTTTDAGARDTTDGTTDGTTLDGRLDEIEQALADGDFTLMLEALNLGGLADEVEESDVTVLAPTDEAFATLSVSEYGDLLSDADAVRELVNRHLIDEVLTYEDLSERTEVTTVGGDVLEVTFDNGVLRVEGGVVTEPAGDLPDGGDGQQIALLSIDTVLLGTE